MLELPDSKGVQLLHGRLKEKEIVAFRNAGKPNQFKLVSCKVIVGRSLAMPSVDEAKKAQLPVGYDSFYLHDTGISADANNSTDTHRYIIKSAWQVLPQYLVVFEFDPAVERRSRESFRCDNCETALAEFHCAADAANLCKECDVLLHSSSKIAQRHRRVPIEKVPLNDIVYFNFMYFIVKAIDALGCCRYHEFQRIEFFCTQCLKAVCVHCKMVGHHSGPETAHHRLVGIAEAFDSIMEESKAVRH